MTRTGAVSVRPGSMKNCIARGAIWRTSSCRSEGENPRFVVTNLPAKGFKNDQDGSRFSPARLYEELYCARGDMENKLKQQVLDLHADRMSTQYMASNQFRLWEAMFAYLLLE